jgi:hypothetical protein
MNKIDPGGREGTGHFTFKKERRRRRRRVWKRLETAPLLNTDPSRPSKKKERKSVVSGARRRFSGRATRSTLPAREEAPTTASR